MNEPELTVEEVFRIHRIMELKAEIKRKKQLQTSCTILMFAVPWFVACTVYNIDQLRRGNKLKPW